MARRTFYSFHYKPDNWRAAQVRNMGVIEGNRPVWLLMPSVSVEVMNLALAEFARDVNPEGKKQIILVR